MRRSSQPLPGRRTLTTTTISESASSCSPPGSSQFASGESAAAAARAGQGAVDQARGKHNCSRETSFDLPLLSFVCAKPCAPTPAPASAPLHATHRA